MAHSQEDVNKILEMVKEGHSYRKISQAVLGRDSASSTISDIVKRYSVSKDSVLTTPGLQKVVLFDIETAPILSYHWGLWKQNIGLTQIKEDWFLLMMSYKTLGEDKVVNLRLPDYEGYKSGRDCEQQLVEDLWLVMDDADIMVGHNGKKFDKKKIFAKFLEYGYPKPSPFKVVDTLHIAKNNFAMTSNKLDYIMGLVADDHKLDTGGFQLWIDCMAGDMTAWDKMSKYCDKDVTGLEDAYLALRAWDDKAPNIALHLNDGKEHCTVCGGSDLEELEKTSNTSVSSFETLRCKGCGHINRRRKSIRTKEQSSNTLMNSLIG